MFQTVSRLLPEVSLVLVTAVATHLVMSFAQTLMHYKLGHHPMGGKFFRNHIHFHHTYYSKDHLVSRTYLGEEGNNTPFFLIPVFLVGGCAYFLLPPRAPAPPASEAGKGRQSRGARHVSAGQHDDRRYGHRADARGFHRRVS